MKSKRFKDSKYIVYEDGAVFSEHVNRFLKPDIVHGYPQYSLGKLGRYKAHQLVALSWIPNPDNLPCVNHKDGNKLNNLPDNLEWCSYAHNNKHAIDTGLRDVAKSNSCRWKDPEFKERVGSKISKFAKLRVGALNSNYKYTLYKEGVSYSVKEVAAELGISYSYAITLVRKKIEGKVVSQLMNFSI